MQKNENISGLPLLILFLGAAGISFAPIFVRISELKPTATAFWRVALATPLFWLWLQSIPKEKIQHHNKNNVVWLILPGLFFAGDLACWHWSIKYTTVANSTLLANFAFIFVSFISWKWLDEKVTWLFACGAFLAVSGVALLVGIDLWNKEYLMGNILGLATAVFYAAYILSIKKARKTFSTWKIMSWSTGFCAIALLPLTLVSQEPFLPKSNQGWLVLFALAVISHFGGQGLIAFSLARLPASLASVTLLLQPLMATLWAWLLLHEELRLWQALAGVMVLAGIFIARKQSIFPKTNG